MKKLLLLFLLLWSLYSNSQGIYGYSVTTLEGFSYSLNSVQNKKILIVTLPTQQTNVTDSLLYSLDTLAEHHVNTLQIIGAPSFEDNFDSTKKQEILAWYRTFLRSEVIITDGLYTRKTSETAQHPMFRWLTDITYNQNFDLDVEGPWSKFFINLQGQLYSVLKPHTKISSRAVNKTLFIQ